MSKKNAVIYLQKSGFSYYSEGISNVFSYTFPPEIALDYEIINRDGFEQAVTTFFQTNKISPSIIVIILSPDTIFELKLINVSKELQINNPEIENFLQYVPFEHVGNLSIPNNKDTIVYATNEDFYRYIKHALEKLQFVVEYVSPSVVAGPTFSPSAVITIESARLLLQKFTSFKQYNFLTASGLQISKQDTTTDATQAIKKKRNKRPFLLGGLFAILLIVLAVMLRSTLQSAPPGKNTPLVLPPLKHSTSLSPSATAIISITPVALALSDVAAQINTSTGTQSTATLLKTLLLSKGIKTITLNDQSTVSVYTVVLFSSDIPQGIKDMLIKNIVNIDNSAKASESSSLTKSIIITLKK